MILVGACLPIYLCNEKSYLPIQNKYGENWELIDIEARNVFIYCTPSMIKSIAGINTCVDRIKDIDKCNVTAAFPICFET